MELMHGPFEGLAALIASVVLPIAIASALVSTSVLAMAVFQDRRGPSRARETLFVGRWGDFGPELYLVGRGVRRLADPNERADATVAFEFSRRMLAEVMRGRPVNQLAWAFASARLEPLPPDGFVISKSDVETWLDLSGSRS